MLPQDCHMPLWLNSYGTLCSDLLSKSCIVQEHVSAKAKVYLIFMYGLDIHSIQPSSSLAQRFFLKFKTRIFCISAHLKIPK